MTDALIMLKEKLTGLQAKRKELANNKSLFLRAAGVDEQAKKARQDAEALAGTIKDLKARHAGLVEKKNAALRTTTAAITAALDTLLPSAGAVFEIDEDGKCLIGWRNEKGNVVAYPGLSGGEKVFFDAALCFALRCNVLLQESAELDIDHFSESLKKYGELDIQAIVSSCHMPKEVPKDWTVIKL
jgi:hypothetical protein